MFDNGKIKISILDKIPLVEVYHDGELELRDIEWINHVVLHELEPILKLPFDIIIDKKGNYSLSIDALANMEELMKDTNRVAYVAHSSTQEKMVQVASSLYLTEKQVAHFRSVSEACLWLTKSKSSG